MIRMVQRLIVMVIDWVQLPFLPFNQQFFHEWTLAVRTSERSCIHHHVVYIPLHFHPKLTNRIAMVHMHYMTISKIPWRELIIYAIM